MTMSLSDRAKDQTRPTRLVIPLSPMAAPRNRTRCLGKGKGLNYMPGNYRIWRQHLSDHLAVLHNTIPCYEGPIEVSIGAFFKRPAATKLDYPVPDVDNIAKAILDGIQGVSFVNDKQVIKVTAEKAWSQPGRPGFIIVNIVPKEAEE